VRISGSRQSRSIETQQIIQGRIAMSECHDLIADSGTPDIFLDESCMALIVLDHDDCYRFGNVGHFITRFTISFASGHDGRTLEIVYVSGTSHNYLAALEK